MHKFNQVCRQKDVTAAAARQMQGEDHGNGTTAAGKATPGESGALTEQSNNAAADPTADQELCKRYMLVAGGLGRGKQPQ